MTRNEENTKNKKTMFIKKIHTLYNSDWQTFKAICFQINYVLIFYFVVQLTIISCHSPVLASSYILYTRIDFINSLISMRLCMRSLPWSYIPYYPYAVQFYIQQNH